ncbi:MAG: CpsB/CapC family capsule biosynthesis tyrosine phosphatase [Flavobacteriales bacterium]
MSFFDRFKSKPKTSANAEAIDMSLIGTDMHSHLLFGIDDGAVSLENSLELIEHLMNMGYRKFITSPHIYRDLYFNSPDTILPKLKIVQDAIKEKGWDVELLAAAEYYLDDHFEDLIAKDELLTMGNKHILFELAFDSEPPNVKRALFNLQLNGYKPILAHPERYDYLHNQFSKYEDFADRDVYLQLNINSLSGHYGPMVKKVSERLIDAGLIRFIGTDCHHVGHVNLTESVRRNPHLRKLIESGKLLNHTL